MISREKRNQMFQDEILEQFIDNAVTKAKQSIEEKGTLTTEDAIPLMLKSQFNHIAHLEQQMVTKAEFQGLKAEFQGLKAEFQGLKAEFQGLKEQFQGLKEQFQGLKEQFTFMKWMIAFGFAFLGALNVYFTFFK